MKKPKNDPTGQHFLPTAQKDMNPNTEADAFRKQAFFTYKEFLIMLNESETEAKK